jgi:hypothetical protein
MAEAERPRTPKTLLSAKRVDLRILNYNDADGREHTQLAVIGDNNVLLLDGKATGLDPRDGAKLAERWLKDQIDKATGKTE